MVTTPIQLGASDWRRSLSQSPYVRLRNRYFEKNPTNQIEQQALLARPALKRWIEVGDGPNRGLYSQPGSFSDALFVMSGEELYKVETTGSATLLGDGFFDDQTTRASMAATAAIGGTPEYLYVADGVALRYYVEDTPAQGELVAPTAPANTERVEIGGVYYAFTSGSVDTGTPAGTSLNPWLVARDADPRVSFQNLSKAVNLNGVAGTTYSTATIINASATVIAVTATGLFVRARAAGTAGNSITTTTTITGASWSGATLAGGVDTGLNVIDLPDGLPAISVAFIAGYIIVVPAPIDGFKGRFFWIEPGETFIRPLNFATAERSPDPIVSVRAVGDQFALFGTTSTEMWYPTGDVLAPFARSQARVFERGVWEGSDIQIKDSLILMDLDGVIYRIDGSGPVRISDNSVEERTRRAIKTAVTQVGPAPGPGPGPLSATLSSPGQTLSAATTFTNFAPILAQATGGIGPYQYRFYWTNRVFGNFGFLGTNLQSLVTPQVISVPNDTEATATLLCEVTDSQGTKVISPGASYRFTNTLAVGTTPPPANPTFTVSLSNRGETVSRRGLSSTTFSPVTATPNGGTGPYTSGWFIESLTGASASINSITSPTTTVSLADVGPGEVGQIVIRCSFTDSLGATGVSNTVVYNLFNLESTPEPGVPIP